jgi:hypothetical protein
MFFSVRLPPAIVFNINSCRVYHPVEVIPPEAEQLSLPSVRIVAAYKSGEPSLAVWSTKSSRILTDESEEIKKKMQQKIVKIGSNRGSPAFQCRGG